MKKIEVNKIIKIAEEQGFKHYFDDDAKEWIAFAICSPEGQDFNTPTFNVGKDVQTDEFVDKFKEYVDDYDPDYNAYIWLGPDGHGRNGAPYRMRDVLNDAEWCGNKVEDLMIAFGQNLLWKRINGLGKTNG